MSEKSLVPKFVSDEIVGPHFFLVQTIVGPNKFDKDKIDGPNKYWVQTNLGCTKFWSQKMLCPEILLFPEMFLGPQECS